MIRGHNIMKGYWNRADANEEAIEDGWFHTGDMAKVDEDGYFFIVDRKKDLIIRGGYNVYPREIEEVLYEHPAVHEAAVVGVPHDELGEEVGAAVVLKEGEAVDEEELKRYVKEQVAAYKYPRRIWFVDELPEGPDGQDPEARDRGAGEGRGLLRVIAGALSHLVDSQRWIRARRGGQTVADSRRTKLLYEPPKVLPVHVFPEEDVRLDLLPEEAITRHEDGLVEIAWDAADEWLEEDEELLGHARDPFHRIDALRTSRHIRVSLGGEPLAETRSAVALFETRLPTRWYIPREDVSRSSRGTTTTHDLRLQGARHALGRGR